MEQVKSKLRDDFLCCCQACDKTMEEDLPNDPRVIIDRCGCIFRKTHLERLLRGKFSEGILRWFKKGGKITSCSCPTANYIVGKEFTPSDIIEDRTDRYREIWDKSLENPDCESFEELTENVELNTRQFALIPELLALELKKISKEQREKEWDDKTWSVFGQALAALRKKYRNGEGEDFQKLLDYEAIEKTTLLDWERRKNQALQNRQPAFDQTGWSLIKKITFAVRFIYHCAVAIIFEYGTWLLRQGNFISINTESDYRNNDVGDRLAILLLEWHGVGYNLDARPLNTVEYRLWRYVRPH